MRSVSSVACDSVDRVTAGEVDGQCQWTGEYWQHDAVCVSLSPSLSVSLSGAHWLFWRRAVLFVFLNGVVILNDTQRDTETDCETARRTLSRTLFLTLSLLSLCLCLTHCLFLSVSVCLWLFPCISVSVHLCISVSVHLSVSLCVCISVSLSPCLLLSLFLSPLPTAETASAASEDSTAARPEATASAAATAAIEAAASIEAAAGAPAAPRPTLVPQTSQTTAAATGPSEVSAVAGAGSATGTAGAAAPDASKAARVARAAEAMRAARAAAMAAEAVFALAVAEDGDVDALAAAASTTAAGALPTVAPATYTFGSPAGMSGILGEMFAAGMARARQDAAADVLALQQASAGSFSMSCARLGLFLWRAVLFVFLDGEVIVNGRERESVCVCVSVSIASAFLAADCLIFFCFCIFCGMVLPFLLRCAKFSLFTEGGC